MQEWAEDGVPSFNKAMGDSEKGQDTPFQPFLIGLVPHFVDEKTENQRREVTHL